MDSQSAEQDAKAGGAIIGAAQSGKEQTMNDIILGIIAVAFVFALFAAVVVMCVCYTETFSAIDEKIARAIKGEENDEAD